MKILAIDTTTEACSCALLLEDNNNIEQKKIIIPKAHSKHILFMVNSLIEKKISSKELDCIAFGCGPGSFTGIRIAASVIQGLSFGWKKPVVPISSLQAVAQGAYRQCGFKKVFATIDARMKEIYWAKFVLGLDFKMRYQGKEMLTSVEEIKIADLENCECVGTGAKYLEKNFAIKKIEFLYPEAQDIAFLATKSYQEGKIYSAEQALPVYLRDKIT